MSNPSVGRQGLKRNRAIWLGLGLAVAFDTAAQLCWKTAVAHVPVSAPVAVTIIATLRQPLFHLTIVLFVLQFANWMSVLARADLSYSHSITALSVVTVTALSHVLLGEHVSPLRLAGMVLILTGVWFIGMTEHHTTGDTPTHQGGMSASGSEP